MRSRRGERFPEAPQDRMPIREAPVDVNEPTNGPGARAGTEFESDLETGGESPAAGADPKHNADRATSVNGAASGSGNGTPVVRGSRWIDYDTHELLEMIGELEDERRWARLREGVLWAILIHLALLFAFILIPRYVLKMRPVIQTDNLRDQKEFTYLDAPFVPRPKLVKPLLRQPQIDQKTLDELKQQARPAPAAPPPPQEQAPVQQQPQPTQPIPPSPQSQSPVEAPRPSAVPARPTFSMDSGNPADQLKRDMQNAMRGRGGEGSQIPMGQLPAHPGAGGGAQILSDTQGVDFSSWLAAWYYDTKRTWDPLIPDEVNPPISKQGQVMIRFKVLPNGRLMDGSVVLEGRSGDVALDRAAWGALTGSSYPPLPKDFHGPYLELRAWFLYNMQPPNQ
jgi:outer membrane biosynthesis protein TonB